MTNTLISKTNNLKEILDDDLNNDYNEENLQKYKTIIEVFLQGKYILMFINVKMFVSS
jgi:hypothetical protein